MDLTVEKEIQDKTITLKLKGILDISTTNNIDPYLEDIESIDMLIFDFSELEFIDSTGLGYIMNAIHLSQEKNFTIKLQGINEITNQVFEMIGLYHILEAIQGEVI
jgi:anti-anti-sigma factor